MAISSLSSILNVIFGQNLYIFQDALTTILSLTSYFMLHIFLFEFFMHNSAQLLAYIQPAGPSMANINKNEESKF